ncbi:hypothetical protein B0A54_15425 [Friedmanniomyces endolithicus]|uniref:Uncharacterized protein n=1 Tax=Friedmanniomyces endolithicus TaxID=329885 RepID=A0A4U0U525_9PEZI|nr:hypothetical protein B0A54_15425 [Friedmanniomyces endolithicus]
MSITLVDFACDASKALSKLSRTAADSDKGHVESPKLIDFATRIYTIAEDVTRTALFRKLDGFLKQRQRADPKIPEPDTLAEEFPNRIFVTFFDTLAQNIDKPKASSRAQFSETIPDEDDTIGGSKGVSLPVRSIEFCQLLLRFHGAVRHQVRIDAGGLYDLKIADLARQMLLPQPSLSLSEALKLNDITDDGKLILAHAIAKSTWQFYGTKVMNTRWTGDKIRFLAEEGTQGRYSPLHPYVSMLFDGSQATSGAVDLEFVPAEGLVHWAPRIFTLGALLVSIMSNSVLIEHDEKWNWREGFNNQAFWCNQTMSNTAWPSLNIKSELLRKMIREAVEACLSAQVFNRRELTIDERKALLYKRVVWPLEYVIKIAGVQETRACWMAKQPNAAILPSSNARNTGTLMQKSSSRSRSWIDRLVSSQLNYDIRSFYKINTTASRTKIAILDTGYDPDSLFFASLPRQKRIKGWKDFVDGSAAQDMDGHGTHVLSTAMKIAPYADVYVARVTKDDADFTQSRERIAQAVRWAVKEMGVDIVSMSFGWPKEDKSRSISQTIETASTERDGRVLFFAAASNSGGDYAEWFPASHDFVNAIRATTSEGSFDTFNAPPNFSGADVIGTLGVDVLGASRDPENPERSDSGTSFATPIAAAIAALVLDAAKINAQASGGQLNKDTYDTLRTRQGMRKMFFAESMSRKMNERSWYLNADSFCSSAEDTRKTELDHAALHA